MEQIPQKDNMDALIGELNAAKEDHARLMDEFADALMALPGEITEKDRLDRLDKANKGMAAAMDRERAAMEVLINSAAGNLENTHG